MTPTGSLPAALERLAAALRAVELTLDVPGRDAAEAGRRELVGQIEDYLLPRLERMHAPLLMVVGGSTGAGKSTLVNSLVGEDVSPSGVLRPTTRAPVLVCHPDDVQWFEDDRILPGLSRTRGTSSTPGSLQLVPTEALPAGLALLDSPDIDSVVEANRALSRQLLAAADAWLFVTTAARYADAVPWDLLQTARDRGTALSLVLDRVPPEAVAEVAGHLRSMLAERGLDDAGLLVVEETALEGGRLPARALAPVRAWLDGLGADGQSRAELVRRTLTGALDSLPGRVRVVAGALAEQAGTEAALREDAEQAYARGLDEVDEAVRSGALLRGEVLARWHDVIGTGDLMRALESRLGRLRDRVRSFVTGTPAAEQELRTAVESSVDAVVFSAADRSAERAAAAWRGRPAGRALLAGTARLDAASPDLLERTRAEVRAWQGDRVRARQPRGGRQALDRPHRVPGRQRRRPRGDAGGVRPHGRPDRRRGRDRGRHLRGGPARARGAARRPGGAHARGAGPRGPPARARASCSPRRRGATRTCSPAPSPAAAASRRSRRPSPGSRAPPTRSSGRGEPLAGGAARGARRSRGAGRRAARARERGGRARRSCAAPASGSGTASRRPSSRSPGPTGAGKSTLFNALAGQPLVREGVRRPTTASATAAVWGPPDGDLLDWLEVPSRHTLDGGGPDGLVLLDLPDFDSVETAHRLEVDRLVRLVDLLVWVVDPQKYADASLHERYLRPLARHAAAMLVVLNQSDRLGADAPRARADLAGLLGSSGLGDVPVLAASARTGEGLDALRAALEDRVTRREAALARLAADVGEAAAALDAAAGEGKPAGLRRGDRARLLATLGSAAGIPAVEAAALSAHRRRGALATGLPWVAWVRRLRPDPLKRLRLSDGPQEDVRTSLPQATSVQRAQVDAGIRALAGDASRGLPDPWPSLARRAATASAPELSDRLDRAVAGAQLRMTRPRWWKPVRVLQLALAATALAGLLWLAVLAGLGYLQLDDVVPTPDIAGIPAPTALLIGGLLAGVLVAFLARIVNGFGARRRARRARRALDERVGAVADELVLAPLEAELAVHGQLRRALATARRA